MGRAVQFTDVVQRQGCGCECVLGGLEAGQLHQLAGIIGAGKDFLDTATLYVSVRGANASTLWPGTVEEFSRITRDAVCALAESLMSMGGGGRSSVELTLRLPENDITKEHLGDVARAFGVLLGPGSPLAFVSFRPQGLFDGVAEFDAVREELARRQDQRRLAFLMGTHRRLGGGSALKELPGDIVAKVLHLSEERGMECEAAASPQTQQQQVPPPPSPCMPEVGQGKVELATEIWTQSDMYFFDMEDSESEGESVASVSSVFREFSEGESVVGTEEVW